MLAIMSAMPEEIAAVVAALTDVRTRGFGQRHYHLGTFHGHELVVVFSHWGKVAAAATATQLITSYGVERLIFSGVAGAVQAGLAIGDIVVASELLQHDLDARPLFARYEVPLLGRASFATDAQLRAQLAAAAGTFLSRDLPELVAASERSAFRIAAPRLHQGLIVSGDKFFASSAELAELRGRLPAALCVEMEGAAVAQVCAEYGVRFGIVRTLSDAADESSVHDFPRFIREVARHYSVGILRRFLEQL